LEGCTSKYIGVNKHRSIWVASICINKKRHYLGSFKTQKEAAIARDAEAIKHKGYKLNEVL